MEFLSLGTILGGITFISIAGGAAAYFSKSRGDNIIAYQEKELELAGVENARLEKENAALRAECNSLKEQNSKLWDKAQGSPQLVALTGQVKRLADEFVKYVKEGS